MTPSPTKPPVQVLLYGGAFDPFHNGHVAAIRLLLTLPQVHQVVVVPSGGRPDKHAVSPAHDRYEMASLGVKAVFGDNPRVVVSDLQSRGVVGFATIDLVTYVRQECGADVGVVIGSELLSDLPQWHCAEQLRRDARFFVLRRPGAPATEPAPGWQVEFLPDFGALGVSVSSTELRARLGRGERCDGLLPEVVQDYCVSRRLYAQGQEA